MEYSTKRIDLKDNAILFDKLFTIQNPLSEYSFSNIFLFRHAHEYSLIEYGEELFISGRTYDGVTYIMPVIDLREARTEYLEKLIQLLSRYDCIFPVPEEWLYLFPREKYHYTYNEDDTDYIFNSKKFTDYPGRKLHGKKNLLNQFYKLYQGTMHLMNKEVIPQALAILDTWQTETGLRPEETDYFPCREALTLYDELKLCGALFFADDKPAGFLIGEEINKDMYGIHFAKSVKSIKGISQYMFSRCAEIHSEMYEFINLEQDMGKDNLRNTKLSYIPDTMARKYRVIKK